MSHREKLKIAWALGALLWILFGAKVLESIRNDNWRGVALLAGTLWAGTFLYWVVTHPPKALPPKRDHD